MQMRILLHALLLCVAALSVFVSAPAYADIVAGGTAGSGSGTTLPVVDTQTIVSGSADVTKLMRFEVDGLTTATTRVFTVPDHAGSTLVTTAAANQTINTGFSFGNNDYFRVGTGCSSAPETLALRSTPIRRRTLCYGGYPRRPMLSSSPKKPIWMRSIMPSACRLTPR